MTFRRKLYLGVGAVSMILPQAGASWLDCDEPKGPRPHRANAHSRPKIQDWRECLPKPEEGSTAYELSALQNKITGDLQKSELDDIKLKKLREKLKREQVGEGRNLCKYWRECDNKTREGYTLKFFGIMEPSDEKTGKKKGFNSVEITLSPNFAVDGDHRMLNFAVEIDEDGEKRHGDLVSTSGSEKRETLKFHGLEPVRPFKYELEFKTKGFSRETVSFWLYETSPQAGGKSQIKFGDANEISKQIAALYIKFKVDSKAYHKQEGGDGPDSGKNRRRLRSLMR